MRGQKMGAKADQKGTGWKVSGGRYDGKTIGKKVSVSALALPKFAAMFVSKVIADVPDASFRRPLTGR